MSQSFKRLNCVICDSNYLVNFINVKMPVYLGQTEDRSQFNFNDYLLAECTNCGEVQLSELVRPEIVYQKSHNSEVVGRTWTEHFSEFSNFIGDLKDKVILEIGDPSKKLTKFKKKFSQWLIVDPNVDKNDEEENIVLLNSFFDENFEIQQKVDIILHSHFFEHTINPSIFLKGSGVALALKKCLFKIGYKVPVIRLDLPEPETPVTTINLL